MKHVNFTPNTLKQATNRKSEAGVAGLAACPLRLCRPQRSGRLGRVTFDHTAGENAIDRAVGRGSLRRGAQCVRACVRGEEWTGASVATPTHRKRKGRDQVRSRTDVHGVVAFQKVDILFELGELGLDGLLLLFLWDCVDDNAQAEINLLQGGVV